MSWYNMAGISAMPTYVVRLVGVEKSVCSVVVVVALA
jgi:hypothetical protein